jgi:methyl-accepting chemotaxis protein
MDKVIQSNAASAEENAASAEELNAQAEIMRCAVVKLMGLVGGQEKIEVVQKDGGRGGRKQQFRPEVSTSRPTVTRPNGKMAGRNGHSEVAQIPLPKDFENF